MTNNQKRLTGAIAIIYREKMGAREFLLAIQKSGNISLIGGGIESGDSSIEDTVRREIREETNLQDSDYELMKINLVHEFIYGNHPTRAGQQACNQVFLVKVDPNVNISPRDIARVEWADFNKAISSFTIPELAKILKESIDYL